MSDAMDRNKNKNGTNAIVSVSVKSGVAASRVADNLAKLEISKVYESTGHRDIYCIINAKNIEHLNKIIDKIRATDGVGDTETMILLRTAKDE